MYKRGLVIGKFYPPHKGHKYLIDTATSQVEQLTVIVCQKYDQVIPAKLRAKWIREIHPGVKVMVVDQGNMPDDDSKLWAKATIDWLGYVPDAVFTSEDYGEPWAKYMGCKHVLVDRKRVHIPISATLIRKDPYKYWKYLEPPVRAYLTKRVCVVGAESTGTTTVAKDLASYFKTAWVPEYGRTYCEGKMVSVFRDSWQSREFTHIAKMQSKMEDELAKYSNKVVICDTDPFATTLWHERYMGYHSPQVKSIADLRKYDLYLLTKDDIPFVQDGTRDGKHIRHWMHQRFIEELIKQHKDFIILSGSRQNRLKNAVKKVRSLYKDNIFLKKVSV